MVQILRPSSALGAALLLAVAAFSPARGAHGETACVAARDVAVWASPRQPRAGRPLRILAVADAAALAGLAILDPDGQEVPVTLARHGGPPWSLAATIVEPRTGTYGIEARRDGAAVACRSVRVADADGRGVPRAQGRAFWESQLAWDRASEAFYSAWIEHLFDAPPEESLSFRALDQVLRDPARNFLHDHLGLGEDGVGPAAIAATPDCADMPYFLRAYFAWKIGLPFGFRTCSRGSAVAPPRCDGLSTSEQPAGARDRVSAFKGFARRLMDGVHSGSARTALGDDATDFYPIALTRAALRPGTIYADPYGHTLMIVQWLPQTVERSGLLLAVDAQPDNSVGRKRFWEGTFLFASDVRGAGPGFKASRPLVRGGSAAGDPAGDARARAGTAAGADGASSAGAGGPLRPLPNASLADDPRFAPYADEQATLAPEDFYARMGRLINPRGLDPARAYDDMLDALVEQLETRVGSVDNGERYMREHGNPIAPMPAGASIFETIGPWEDYSTPSRDMRLIIAMNVLARLPERIVRHPDLFVLDGRRPEDAAAEVERRHTRRIAERGITYTRSDGSPWRLTVADVLARKAAFEVAYNPNDCAEVRWGASEGTPEHATCKRRAPAEQRARMAEYRAWFREARRPPR